MPDRIIMPKTGMAMEEGTLVRWLKQPGETVSRGEAIAVIETDKVTMELESEYDGTLLEIVHRDGDVVPVTHTIAWVGAPGENIPADADRAAASPAAASTPAPASPAEHAPGTTFRDGKIPATPAARAAAAAAGIPLASVAGSGPCGAVRLKDLAPAPTIVPAAGSQPAPETSIPVSGMRRAIAEKMLRSHQQVPSVTLVTRADVTELAALRSKMNAGGGQKVSWTDFILRAAAAALRRAPPAQFRHRGGPDPREAGDRHRHRGGPRDGARRAGNPGCGYAHRAPGRRSGAGPGGARAVGVTGTAGMHRRHVHDHQPRHVRDHGVHAAHQRSAERHPGRGLDRGSLSNGAGAASRRGR